MNNNRSLSSEDWSSGHDCKRRFSRVVTLCIGAAIGPAVGMASIRAARPLIGRPDELQGCGILLVMAAVGAIVGLVQRAPPLIGSVVGTLCVATWARIVGPQNPMGVINVLGGPLLASSVESLSV